MTAKDIVIVAVKMFWIYLKSVRMREMNSIAELRSERYDETSFIHLEEDCGSLVGEVEMLDDDL